MGKQAGLLVALMVVALGSGAVAQEPSPEASPLFAPDDLAFTIPSQIGSLELVVGEADGDRWLEDPEHRETLLELLMPYGKGPEDFLFAYGLAPETVDGAAYVEVRAYRIIGVDGVALAEQELRREQDPATDLAPQIEVRWEEVDGRPLVLVTTEGFDDWLIHYPVGEVLYTVMGGGGITVEDVLAELP